MQPTHPRRPRVQGCQSVSWGWPGGCQRRGKQCAAAQRREKSNANGPNKGMDGVCPEGSPVRREKKRARATSKCWNPVNANGVGGYAETGGLAAPLASQAERAHNVGPETAKLNDTVQGGLDGGHPVVFVVGGSTDHPTKHDRKKASQEEPAESLQPPFGSGATNLRIGSKPASEWSQAARAKRRDCALQERQLLRGASARCTITSGAGTRHLRLGDGSRQHTWRGVGGGAVGPSPTVVAGWQDRRHFDVVCAIDRRVET